MPINQEIIRIFYEIADMLEMKADRWRTVAYRTAARAIRDLREDLTKIQKRGELEDIPGIGEALSAKITEYIKTGKISSYEKLKKTFPTGLRTIMDVPGMGPRKAKALYEKLNIKSISDLKKAIKQQKIRKLQGFGIRSEKVIEENLSFINLQKKKEPYAKMFKIGNDIMNEMRSCVQKIVLAGSIRRKEKMVGDIDIVAISNNPKRVMDKFTTLRNIKKVIAGSGNFIVDLKLITDSFKVAPNFSNVKMIYAKCLDGAILVGAQGVNAFVTPWKATDQGNVLRPGGTLLLVAPDLAGFNVITDTGDELIILNGDAVNPATFELLIFGVKN